MAVYSNDSNELVFQEVPGKTTKMGRSYVNSNTAYKSFEQVKKTRDSTDQRKHKTRLISNLKRRKSLFHSHHSLRANLFLISLSLVLYFTFNQHSTSVEACLCHLIPNFQCPPPPHCCESGQYAKDECGCCLTCAKSELQPCGGPSGAHGKCAAGLQCLKTCSKSISFLSVN